MNTIKLYETPVNNHGCQGFEVAIQPITDDTGIVLAGRSCSSCWQVGHDTDESPVVVGSIVHLPMLGALKWNKDAPVWVQLHQEWKPVSWFYSLSWTSAQHPCGHSHNELVDDVGEEIVGWNDDDGEEVVRLREPQPDCTLVRPSDLEIIGRVIQLKAASDLAAKKIGFSEFKRIVRETPESFPSD